MKNYFTISEFLFQNVINAEVADKILLHHIMPMNVVREKLGCPITVQSGFRSYGHEIEQGRSGRSEHVFNYLGAADYTTELGKIKELGQLLVLETAYKRICYYPNNHFFHCDYKKDTRTLYVCENGHDWMESALWLN